MAVKQASAGSGYTACRFSFRICQALLRNIVYAAEKPFSGGSINLLSYLFMQHGPHLKAKVVFGIKRYAGQNKLLLILLAALFTMLLLIALVKLGRQKEDLPGTAFYEQDGLYDLTSIADLKGGVFSLIPGPTYYPSTYLSPLAGGYEQGEKTERWEEIRADYLSQRFLVQLPKGDDIYTLTVKLSGRHALRVYVNGNLTGQAGQVATNKTETVLWENNLTVYGSAVQGEMEIILHIAQFYHAKRGAGLATISLRKADGEPIPLTYTQIKGIAIMGALLFAALLLFGIYLLLSRTRATFYFALACVVMALRQCLESQAWVYFSIPGNLSFMLEYLSLALLTIFLTVYLAQYASGPFLRLVQYTAILGSSAYGTLTLFSDSLIYTRALQYYQLLLIACIVPGIALLLWKMRNPNKEQGAAIFGISVFFMAALRDILMYRDLLGNGPKVPVSEAAMLVFVVAQTVSLFQMNNRVLAEAQAVEQKLEAEKQALESLNQMKTEFLGNVSHELKTPLTVMSGYAQTTKQLAATTDTGQAEEISRRMTLISSEAERLSLMVGQILDVSRMEEGRMQMEPVVCHLDEIIHAAVETHYPILNKNQNRLEIRIESGLPALYADPGRIGQVIVNLIANALHHTKAGEISITARREQDRILVSVADTGAGIHPERLPHIFERYGREQKSGSGKNTGTGLGLYICKHIVEEHGGEIYIESEVGSGTRVYFTLPPAP